MSQAITWSVVEKACLSVPRTDWQAALHLKG